MLGLKFINLFDGSVIKEYASAHQNIPREGDEIIIEGGTYGVKKVSFNYNLDCIYIYCE